MTDARALLDAAALLDELAAIPPGERAARLIAAGDPAALLAALGEAADRRAAGESGPALAARDLVVDLADALALPAARVEARAACASTLAYLGRFDDALDACAEAAVIAGEAGLPVPAARARLGSVHPLVSLGRFDEALAAAEDARAAFLAAGEEKLAARAEINLGTVHEMRDDPVAALACYDRARPAVADDPVLLAQLDSNRGLALLALGEPAAAEAALTGAVRTFAAEGLDWAAAVAEENLAWIAARQGRFAAALEHFERGRRHLEWDDAPVHLARLRSDEAGALAAIGLARQAAEAWRAVLPDLDARGLVAEAAEARLGLGRALLRLGQVADADAALAEAAAGFAALGLPIPGERAGLARAEAAAAIGDFGQARALATDALAAVADRPADAAQAHAELARIALAAGDAGDARAHVAAALPAAERLDLAPLRADLLHLRGRVHRHVGDPAAALADFRAAVAQSERVRGELQAERFRVAWQGDRATLYEDALLAALDLPGDEGLADAFALAEAAKGRALLDVVAGALDLADAAGRADDPAEAALLADLAALRAERAWLHAAEAEDAPDPTSDDRRDRLRAVEARLDALEDRLAVARGIAGLYAPPLGLDGALAMLRPGTALVEWTAAGGELLAFVLRDGRATVVRGLCRLEDLAAHAPRIGFQVSRALAAGSAGMAGPRGDRLLSDVRRELGVLHAAVMAPLRPLLVGVERLALVPHGPLHALPLHALWDGEAWLVERFAVAYAPSAGVLAHLAANERAPAGPPLVVGVADAAAPRIADEAVRLARVLPDARLLLGGDATSERVSDDAARAGLVHLACHGRFLPGDPLGSGLKLADRWLTVRDVYRLRLRAALVTLSGCETGRAAVEAGDEVLGLVRGFLAAGASALVIGQWLVDDEAASDLMERFYGAFLAGAPPAVALRGAQRAAMERSPHPAFWAPFVLGGTP